MNDSIKAMLTVNPSDVCTSDLHDSTESQNEFNDLDELVRDMRVNGQIEPCIVRLITNPTICKYQLIDGERRWRAALILNMPLNIIVENMTDRQAAIYQKAANSSPIKLHDYR